MAKKKVQRVLVGTDTLVGAVVTQVGYSLYDPWKFEKDGRTFEMDIEEDYGFYSCMCEGPCCCFSYPSSYNMITYEIL
jgi:hypothetical protein